MRAWPLLGLLAVAAAGATLLWFVDPQQSSIPFPSCPSLWLTGLFCPGCGTTRALHALVHGDLPRALSMNPLLVISLPAVTVLLAQALRVLPRSLEPIARHLGNARAWAIVLISYAVIRNLPWPPFSWLAPGGLG